MTVIMQRKCGTCATKNDEENLFCRTCNGILSKSTLIEGTIAPPSPVAYPEEDVVPTVAGSTSGLPPATVGTAGDTPVQSRRPGGGKRRMGLVGALSVFTAFIIVVGGLGVGEAIYHSSNSPTPTSTATATATPALPQLPNVLGVKKFPGGQYVGINDGSFPPFDIYRVRPDSTLVNKAAQALSQQPPDKNAAGIDLNNALGIDTNDAEAGIYLENINAVDSGTYVSLVVAVDFDPKDSDLSAQRRLQGAYTAQKEFNDNSNSMVKIRLLVANTARVRSYDIPVAQQIVNIAQKEHIVGVLGWTDSSGCHEVISTLAAHGIPLLAPTASSDDLTGISHYFFRIVPPNTVQAQTSADFATSPEPQGLNAKNAVVFFDPTDSYSLSIARDFETDFTKNGGTILPETDSVYSNKKLVKGVPFNTDNTRQKSFFDSITKVLKKNPDVNVFYFAGVSLYDATEFQKALPAVAKYPNLHVISEDASYVSKSNAQNRWYFTAFAYHDEWSIITQGHQIDPSPFLGPHNNDGEYHKNFDPDFKHINSPYEFDLPAAATIVSYDGVNALAQAITAQKDPYNITSQGIATALPQIAFQGVSGYISFGSKSSNGDPVNKTIVMLLATSTGIQMRCVGGGTFYPGVNQSTHKCSS